MSKQHSTLSKGQNFTINWFDIVAVFNNKVECCFDIVAGADGDFTDPMHFLPANKLCQSIQWNSSTDVNHTMDPIIYGSTADF